MMDPWLGFLNEQVAESTVSGSGLERARVRQTILDRAACSFPFPLEVSFRGAVVDRLTYDGEAYLVVEPALLRQEAIDVVGGILLPSERRLRPGSLVEVCCHLADPDAYWMDEGVLALDAEIQARVPIEP